MEVASRRHFEPHEVPLPPGGGFTHALLDPEYKAELRRRHEERIREVMEERVLLYDRCLNYPDTRKLVYERCKREPEWFIDMFVLTYDDREGQIKAMVLFDFQRDKLCRPYVEMCNTPAPKRYTGMMAKSRAMGWSWVSMALRACSFLFRSNWSILVGGQQRDDVDDGGMAATQQSLFGKLRFIINNLPKWMKMDLLGPAFFKDSSSNSYNKRMMLRNPLRPQNMIQGSQFGPTFGRGARFAEVFEDEVAWAEGMADADTSLKQTTNRVFGGSTPQGMVGYFPQMMFGELEVHRFWCWWGEHPFLSVEWYNQQRQHMTDEQIAQELDISFERSLGGTVIQNIDLTKFFRDDVDWDPHLPTEVWIDPGFADHMAAIWVQWDRHREEGRIIDIVVTRRHRIDWLVPFILGFSPEHDSKQELWPHTYNEIEEEIIARHDQWIQAQGPPQVCGDFAGGAKGAATGTSCWDELEAYGIFVDAPKMPTNKVALEHMNLVLRHCCAAGRLRDQRNGPKDESPTLLEVMAQWRYPARKPGAVNAPDKPVHDRFCHPGDCIKMWCWDHEVPRATVMDVRVKRTAEADPRLRKNTYRDPWRS